MKFLTKRDRFYLWIEPDVEEEDESALERVENCEDVGEEHCMVADVKQAKRPCEAKQGEDAKSAA